MTTRGRFADMIRSLLAADGRAPRPADAGPDSGGFSLEPSPTGGPAVRIATFPATSADSGSHDPWARARALALARTLEESGCTFPQDGVTTSMFDVLPPEGRTLYTWLITLAWPDGTLTTAAGTLLADPAQETLSGLRRRAINTAVQRAGRAEQDAAVLLCSLEPDQLD